MVSFGLNRFLRIYPTYWAIALFSLINIMLFPSIADHLNTALNLPTRDIDAVAQITIVGLHKFVYLNQTRFVPPAWSLNIELMYYAAIALLLGRSVYISGIWWIASLALAAKCLWTGDTHTAYFTTWGPSICFSTGAMLSHFRNRTPKILNSGLAKSMTIALIIMAGFLHDAVPTLGILPILYSVIPITSMAILSCQHNWKNRYVVYTDRFLADLSYPMFLLHWPVAVLIAGIGLSGANPSLRLLAISIPVTIAASVVINRVVEEPIRAARSVVRERARSTIALGAPEGLLTKV